MQNFLLFLFAYNAESGSFPRNVFKIQDVKAIVWWKALNNKKSGGWGRDGKTFYLQTPPPPFFSMNKKTVAKLVEKRHEYRQITSFSITNFPLLQIFTPSLCP